MNQCLLDYLKQQKFEGFSKLNFSPVPKGQSGDLAISFFQLTKELKKSPVQIAQEVEEILKKSDLVEETKIAGPYLNITFNPEVFFQKVFETPLDSTLLSNKNIVLEYSGPNTNKPLHLGHMRNHALGLSLSRILKQAGATVHPVNIINDRGVHICKSMLAYEKFGERKTPESEGQKSDHFVGDYYVKFDQESKKDESLNDEVQKILLKWEDGDNKTRALWKKMNEWTINGHQKTYDRQYIKFEKQYLESDYYLEGKNIAQKGLKKGVFEKREDGAIVINFEDEQLGEKVILRADGTSIYLTQDLAVAVARDNDFNHPDELIYTVADEQNYHFKVLFQCLDKLGIMNAEKCHHLSYGLVHLPDGRMKSREGNVVDADNLMDELHDLAAEKIRSNETKLTATEITKTAEQIQNAAWKFYLLRTTPIKSMTFDKEKSIDFQGSTGPYLQYAGVRIKSILKKSKEKKRSCWCHQSDRATLSPFPYASILDQKTILVKKKQFHKHKKLKDIKKVIMQGSTQVIFDGEILWSHFAHKPPRERHARQSWARTMLFAIQNMSFNAQNEGYFICRNRVFRVILSKVDEKTFIVKTYYQDQKRTREWQQSPNDVTSDFLCFSNSEKPLGIKILEWTHTLNRAAEAKNPTYILTYLLELAQEWSSFYASNSVLSAETPELINARVALATKVLEVLEVGLDCLGIEVPERM